MSSKKNVSKNETIVKFRKVYSKPRLELLGDLRSLTLGVSFGIDESSSTGMNRKRKVGLPIHGYSVTNPGATPFDSSGIISPDQTQTP